MNNAKYKPDKETKKRLPDKNTTNIMKTLLEAIYNGKRKHETLADFILKECETSPAEQCDYDTSKCRSFKIIYRVEDNFDKDYYIQACAQLKFDMLSRIKR